MLALRLLATVVEDRGVLATAWLVASNSIYYLVFFSAILLASKHGRRILNKGGASRQ